MYIEGSPYTLERRIHQFLVSQDDYDDYLEEYETIQDTIPTWMQVKIQRELDKKKIIYRLVEAGGGNGGGDPSFLITEDGDNLVTENLNALITE